MKVAVHYLAQLKQAAGIATESVTLDGPCFLQTLLTHLAERHGEAFRRVLLNPVGGLQESILLFVGEEQVRWETPVDLKDGDVVTILAPMAGG
jgi:molybdopterin converting factor small subunit